jgi:hypothetical protein
MIFHNAIITNRSHDFGDNYIDTTAEGLIKQIADWCRVWWDVQFGVGMEPMPEADLEVIKEYFESNDEEFVQIFDPMEVTLWAAAHLMKMIPMTSTASALTVALQLSTAKPLMDILIHQFHAKPAVGNHVIYHADPHLD